MQLPNRLQQARGDTGLVAFRAPAAAIVLALLLPGCAVNGLSFVEDTRVDIVRPADRSEVRLPVTIEWTAEDIDVGPGRGGFGVLVDRAPPPPDKPLQWLFRDDLGCKGAGARLCASDGYLGDRAIFRTTGTRVTLQQVPRLVGSSAGRVLHEATIVLLDAEGDRIGESAWTVQFEVEGED